MTSQQNQEKAAEGLVRVQAWITPELRNLAKFTAGAGGLSLSDWIAKLVEENIKEPRKSA